MILFQEPKTISQILGSVTDVWFWIFTLWLAQRRFRNAFWFGRHLVPANRDDVVVIEFQKLYSKNKTYDEALEEYELEKLARTFIWHKRTRHLYLFLIAHIRTWKLAFSRAFLSDEMCEFRARWANALDPKRLDK